MKEIILKFLLENTNTIGLYTGGGAEPVFVSFPYSEDIDREKYLDCLSEELAKKLQDKKL